MVLKCTKENMISGVEGKCLSVLPILPTRIPQVASSWFFYLEAWDYTKRKKKKTLPTGWTLFKRKSFLRFQQ